MLIWQTVLPLAELSARCCSLNQRKDRRASRWNERNNRPSVRDQARNESKMICDLQSCSENLNDGWIYSSSASAAGAAGGFRSNESWRVFPRSSHRSSVY